MEHLQEDLFNFNPWWEGRYKPSIHMREKYLIRLKQSLSKKEIVILTGLRRVGKTSIMKLMIKELLENISPKKLFYVSLDSIALEQIPVHELLREYRKLHQLKRDEKIFVFLDEAAYRENINQELKNLFDNENVKIFISSSSSSILRDKSSLLTGRTKIIEVTPLDFREYLQFKNISVKNSEQYLFEKYFENYMQQGGMPEFVLYGDFEYLDNLVDSIIYKDIAYYRGVKDTTSLKEFFRLLMERAGKQLSLTKIAKVIGISTETVKRYFEYFQSTYLIYAIERCGKLNERLRAPKKIYAADVGIRNFITGFRDKGAIFENLFYFLIKSKSPCYVYKNSTEIDFYFDKTLCEIKYGRVMEKKQQTLFEETKAEQKIIISSIADYLKYDNF